MYDNDKLEDIILVVIPFILGAVLLPIGIVTILKAIGIFFATAIGIVAIIVMIRVVRFLITDVMRKKK